MTSETLFPSLNGFEPTRQTLQLYSRVVGVVPRAHGEFHPRWWHISLKVQADGLVTDQMALPDGGSFSLKMDLRRHAIVLFANGQAVRTFDMTAGTSASAVGDAILGAVNELGLTSEYAREKFENDEPRQYDPAKAETFLTALTNADRIFKAHRETLSGEVGPVQVWPHGFDLAFEWFGTRVQTYEEHGQVQELPSQLNLGLYPGNTEDAYFYSNPWPFEGDVLLNKALPAGARWHNEGWQGSVLPYAELVGDVDAEQRLREYARVVYELVSPTLLAMRIAARGSG
jgi:hypothetical protein